MKAMIRTVPASDQRYPTCGDWILEATETTDAPAWTITVSALEDWRMELLVAVHELIEAALCYHRGITDQDVTLFDQAYERRHKANNDAEPGDDLAAPYHREHLFATNLERLLAAELHVHWNDYEDQLALMG